MACQVGSFIEGCPHGSGQGGYCVFSLVVGNLPMETESGVTLELRAGQSVFPNSGRNSRMLMKKAMETSELRKLGLASMNEEVKSADYFEARSALPET